MDHTSFRTRLAAEREARQAAAEAHASYYAHPRLHLHTYLHRTPSGRVLASSPEERRELAALNASDAVLDEGFRNRDDRVGGGDDQDPAGSDKTKVEEGMKEEEGGKEDAGKPSGLDAGALEIGGEAHGTHTQPGPSVDLVEKYMAQEKSGDTSPSAPEAKGDMERVNRHWSSVHRMKPHLQLMCGPLLAYYTTKDNVWNGAAMVVTADEGSVYDPPPSLSLSLSPYSPPSSSKLPAAATNGLSIGHNQPITLESRNINAKKYNEYSGKKGTSSFWRFVIEITLQPYEMTVKYKLNGGAEMSFVVPATGQNFRWAAHSCNGFSSGVNPDKYKGDFPSGYDPVWEDLLLNHAQKPFHCMVGGGDQIYCDPITREPELQAWVNEPDRGHKLAHPLTDDIKSAVDRFYFNHYCKIFRSSAFARANSSIPMVNMLDDHDLIDGFGTYDDETQGSPIMSFIGHRGYFWFLIFQLFINDAVDGTDPTIGKHWVKSMIIGQPGAWIPFPSHSLLVYLGPKVVLLALDCRAERKLGRIVSRETYTKTLGELAKCKGVEQVVLLLGVPIAYPRMSFLEHFLDLKYNPINVLARHNAMGLGGMVNKFNQASELLDDLNDHWCANVHKKERNWLVLVVQELALEMGARVTFLSGDVHLAAVGCLFTKARPGRKLPPEKDHRYMLNVVTSAIVNEPPPAGAAKMVAMLGAHKHRTLHKVKTDEILIPLFTQDTDGSHMKRKLVQPRRNYAAVEYKEDGELMFDIRCEKDHGAGETVGYPISAPAPRWDVNTPI